MDRRQTAPHPSRSTSQPHERRRLGTRRATGAASANRTVTSPLSLRRRSVRARYWFALGVLTVLLVLVAVGPLYWLVTGALTSTAELLRTPPAMVPTHVEWSNLTYAWGRLQAGSSC